MDILFSTAFIYFSLQLLVDTNNISVCMLSVLPASARSGGGGGGGGASVLLLKNATLRWLYLHSSESRTSYIHTEINTVIFFIRKL